MEIHVYEKKNLKTHLTNLAREDMMNSGLQQFCMKTRLSVILSC